MAYKIVPFYNIWSSVGRLGVNQRDDVILVQYFLTEIAKTNTPIPPPSMLLKVTGQSDVLLEEWIEWFQLCVKKIQGRGIVDKRVDPAKTVNNVAQQEHDGIFFGVGTMADLNATYRKRYRNNHDNLERSGCPVVFKNC